uniref:G-protein coupled receptors family 3 profile domain-containing protein n=1 Tax=Strigamia maritima TaxID=126957 RepID=T1IT32_STRMM
MARSWTPPSSLTTLAAAVWLSLLELCTAQLAASIPGSLVLGGLFPVHQKGDRTSCGHLNKARGIQRVEAMLYAVDRINADPRILPNIQLGALVLDTCSLDTYALNQSLEFIRAALINTVDASALECADGSEPRERDGARPVTVAGVVGASITSVSIQVANLLRLFRIPQISPASTGEMLSDKTRFEFFARTVPPDNFQALALVDIVQQLNWTYVSTVASEDQYGEAGIDRFQREARARNICIGASEKVPHKANASAFDAIVRNLERNAARGVVLFIVSDDLRGVLLAAKRANVSLSWVASDAWGRQAKLLEGLEDVAEGAITVELEYVEMEEFDEHMMSLTPHNNSRNPWFSEFWEESFQCILSNYTQQYVQNKTQQLPLCSDGLRLDRHVYTQDSKVQFVIDAVYAFAHAYHNLHTNVCGPQSRHVCPAMRSYDGFEFYWNYLLNVSFIDLAGSEVKFDERGDGLGRYIIMNYQMIGNNSYEYKVIGKWFNGLRMDPDDIVWNGARREVPQSVCSQPCSIGQIKIVQQSDPCCWICAHCKDWEFVYDEFTCIDCGEGRWPHPHKTSCFDLPQMYMRWNTVFALVPVAISCTGVVLTMGVIAVFMCHNDTPVVKASGRELSYMLLCGILCCYLITFVLLAKPSTFVCALQRFGVSFGFSIIYGALLTKTNRISRIFDSASRSAKRPGFISPRSQVMITLLFISVQVVATVVWLIVEPPGIRPSSPDGKRDIVILKCKIEDSSFLVSLVYNMFLITTCTVYAIKTRKIPENFNESKFIGFTMYTTCIIWLAFIPIYFGTGNSFEVKNNNK